MFMLMPWPGIDVFLLHTGDYKIIPSHITDTKLLKSELKSP
jgi:hypothetical protein